MSFEVTRAVEKGFTAEYAPSNLKFTIRCLSRFSRWKWVAVSGTAISTPIRPARRPCQERASLVEEFTRNSGKGPTEKSGSRSMDGALPVS